MKVLSFLPITFVVLVSCQIKNEDSPVEGTWQLVTGTLIEKKDTVVTDYTKDKKFIKIINDSHFSFLGHDLNKGADSLTRFYTSGGGKYTLADSVYTEHLEFCTDRTWERNQFHFTVSVRNDTLIQSGVEKVEGTGINRYNIEKYVRVKP